MKAAPALLLVDPNDASPLVGEEQAWLNPRTGQRYPRQGALSVLLPANGRMDSQTHQQLGSHFDYQDHYQIDADYYDYFAQPRGATLHSEQRRHQVLAQLVPSQTRTLLDVGSGGAWCARRFCPQGVAVTSFDIAVRNVEKALQLFPHPLHQGVAGDAMYMPLASAQFDVVLASEVIEHVPDPARFLAQLWPLVKPGGRLVISTPYQENIEYHLCVHCNRPTPAHAHLHRFDERSLHDLLRLKPGEGRYFYQTFLNKALIQLRTHVLLRHLPYPLWRGLDRLANGLKHAPQNIVAVWEKGLA